VAATVLLVVLAGLVATALVPRAVGLEAHVVVSGSMAPQVRAGDVVLTRPATAQDLHPGQVLLFAHPQEPGRLLLHRLVSVDAEGRLVTRGDANQSDDAVHVAPSDVRGVARLRLPVVGLPALWRAEGRFGHLALTAALLAGVSVFASRGWGRGRGPSAASASPVPGPHAPAQGPAPARR
jgi:signal peptidase I